MNEEITIKELLEKGYSEEEALEIIKEMEEEKEHLEYFRFQEINRYIFSLWIFRIIMYLLINH